VALLSHLWWLPDAGAQQGDRPLLLPTDDVVVTYRIDGMPMSAPHKMQITYAKDGERVRMDYFHWPETKYPFLASIFDRPANRVILVQPERKAYIDRQIGNNINNPGALLKPNMRFTRQGSSEVAHARCTVWRVELPDKPDDGTTACVTDNGIVLRMESTKPTATTLTAMDIHYGAPPDGAFDPPVGFKREVER
jgi:hypothetical protein